MTRARQDRRRGSAMVEFAIAGIAAVTLMISTVQLALVMWNYHTLAHAVHETNRFIASHGRSCTMGGNTCGITVSDIVAQLKFFGTGLPDDKVILTLTSQSGVVYTCNPVRSCANDATQWPPVAHFDNNPGQYTTLTARLTVTPAILALWYGIQGTQISSVTLPATSAIPIVF